MKKTCFNCEGEQVEFQGVRKGVSYRAYRCAQCGEITFSMEQAERYLKTAEKAKQVTMSKWGDSLAIRIPKAIVEAFGLRKNKKASIIREKDGFKVVPA